MGIKSGQALKQLWSMGMTGITINTVLDFDSASLLAAEFGFEVENVAFREEELIQQQQDRDEDLEPRSPVVTVMGHVDHGKTSLLDKIRDADVANSEAGGITQHVGAYKVKTSTGDIVFIDTPGHEAFTQMRARGAQCTDLVILVVAADDGVMPQTKEAIEHSRDAGVPLVVAINKSDKADANPQKVRQELTTYELVAEEWGGDTLMVDVSAVTGQGIDQLLENVLLQSEMLELKANPKKGARGVVLEALLDKARGPVSTLLVQEGTLKQGSIVLAGEYYGKVRAMLDHRGNQVKEAGPSTPVRILGLDGVPESGENFYVIGDEKDAKRIIDHRREEKRKKELAESSSSAIRLDRIAEMIKEGKQKELKVVLKTDVQGTAEAIKDSVSKLTTEKVKVSVVLSGVGGITETDVTFAKAAGAIIVGFNVRPAGKAAQAAEKEQVEIRLYNVIYELLDDLKEVMRGLLPKDRLEKTVGHAEVRQTFTIPKVGTIAGCFVSDGKISRSSSVRLFREDVKIYQGRIGSLRRFKEDVREVEKGYECGLSIENYNDVKVGDVVEAFEIEEVAATLE
jgi:translation initiation factor IF-2